ncbi:unnamed protein product [Rotaria sp. Silwood1]|nr:unnamed protein product [Rotaria sp. Silwood1]CAF3959829.1 unnamed protein product [Rotaria sp. Silwood1]CAF4862584.1 unnamed protein product [Rotaria sp. Silwood1]CAF4889357.1 unnamed protein product [Rotaria sp. Silwood1]
MTCFPLLSFLIAVVLVATVSSSDERNIVRIINSGSTNTNGYAIELHREGIVKWSVTHRGHQISSTTPSTPSSTTTQMSIRLPSALVISVFQALQQASPLNQYPPIFCIKSVSFGTTLHVIYNGQQSPDLDCPLEDSRLISLNKAVREVISFLHINTLG